MIWVGILGAEGYFGEELSKLVAGHQSAQISSMMDLQELFGSEPCRYNTEKAMWAMLNAVEKSDVIFNGLSGAIAEDLYSKALSYNKRIIDISRSKCTNIHPGSVYGLSKLYKNKMKYTSIVKNPSRYCICTILGMAPLAAGNYDGISIDSIELISGIAGLGRDNKLTETDEINNGRTKAYKMESEGFAEEVNDQMLMLFGRKMSTSLSVYIVPGVKGISATIKINPHIGFCISDVLDIYKAYYRGNTLIEVCDSNDIIESKSRFGRCFCRIKASIDEDCGIATVTAVLDDALRGTASQAIQTMNLMCGIEGEIGL